MPDGEVIRNGDNLSVPMWHCALCGTTGETETPAEASAAQREHFRAAHQQNADPAANWVAWVEAKHGVPLDEVPGKVYVLHYDVPQIVKSFSDDYAGPSPKADADGFLSARPIRHYVGWTQQAKPSKRYTRHGPAAHREVVYLEPGTVRDEQALKLNGSCPKCGERFAADLAL